MMMDLGSCFCFLFARDGWFFLGQFAGYLVWISCGVVLIICMAALSGMSVWVACLVMFGAGCLTYFSLSLCVCVWLLVLTSWAGHDLFCSVFGSEFVRLFFFIWMVLLPLLPPLGFCSRSVLVFLSRRRTDTTCIHMRCALLACKSSGRIFGMSVSLLAWSTSVSGPSMFNVDGFVCDSWPVSPHWNCHFGSHGRTGHIGMQQNQIRSLLSSTRKHNGRRTR